MEKLQKIIDSIFILEKINIENKYIQFYCDNYDNINMDVEEYAGYIITQNKNNLDEKDILNIENISSYIYPCFKKFVKEEEEYFNFLNCPDVEESIYTCGKCKSKKIYMFSKQTRAGDEATTVFAICTSCKNNWILN